MSAARPPHIGARVVFSVTLASCAEPTSPAETTESLDDDGVEEGQAAETGQAPASDSAPSPTDDGVDESSDATGDATGDDPPWVPPTCGREPTPGLPPSAPMLVPGQWLDITPPGFAKLDPYSMIAQGITRDPCDPATLYWGNTPYTDANGGLFKTNDAGGTWTKMGLLDMPLHTHIDPEDTQHLYVGDGVRGATMGFWESFDGGETFEKPAGFAAVGGSIGAFVEDVYDVAVDPTDFDHVLVSSHSPWGWKETVWNTDAGMLESLDGGDTWIVHTPQKGIGWGHSINFLYEPTLGIGNANTWLLGTQGTTSWRTEDAGETWTAVGAAIQHGGGTIYYTQDGVLYASGFPENVRSMDNGVTWEGIGSGYSTCVFGTGTTLFTAPVYGDTPLLASDEGDGLTWAPSNKQTFPDGGPYEMAYDEINGIVYASLWMQGVWALKL